MSAERENLTWENYGTAARDLAKIVADDNYQPDIILAIARGGLFVAGSLGYALSVKNLYVMNVEYYTGVEERLDVPVALPPYLDSIDLRNARVLIADDVADTGATLAYVHEFCKSEVAVLGALFCMKRALQLLNVNMSGKELIIGLIFLGLLRSLYCHHLMEEQLFLMRDV